MCTRFKPIRQGVNEAAPQHVFPGQASVWAQVTTDITITNAVLLLGRVLAPVCVGFGWHFVQVFVVRLNGCAVCQWWAPSGARTLRGGY